MADSFAREGCDVDDPVLDALRADTAAHNARMQQLHGLPSLDPVELAAEQVVLRAAHEQSPVEPEPAPDITTESEIETTHSQRPDEYR